ncbi:hypothetical protein DdX_16398 [Ditylenchus destructor]|uniref:F-box domain-containing protein n=1 Tax=Ditylenchus destructor TaxID=166010 RepID=A0AAD4QZX9_9BILA|nr:hypothetical protein DdX_16398 [Ditylenchus destructor]
MSSLPNEIFYNISKFLPNDDITDLMLMSKKFNGLVTPRLQKIDQAKRRFTEVLEEDYKELAREIAPILGFWNGICDQDKVDKYKERMSLERFDNATFVRILAALVSLPKFRAEYNSPKKLARYIRIAVRFDEAFEDVRRIWSFYNENA